MRTSNARILIEILFCVLALRLFYLQIVKGNFYFSLSSKNYVRVIPQEGSRGRIIDSRGQPIVDNKISYHISVLPIEFRKDKKTVSRLSSLLGISIEKINSSIKKNFVSSFTPVVIARYVDKKTAFFIEENKLTLPGVMVQAVSERNYPHQGLASHTVGYLAKIDRWRITRLKDYGYRTKDIVGFGGIEEACEQLLRARDGGMQIQVDHRGRISRVLGFREPESGRDVSLTIDWRIQKIIEDSFDGRRGAGVLMDVTTGRIIALISSPGFYPGAFLDEDSSAYISGILSDSDTPLRNRAISGQYPPGSVFKIVSAIAGLEKKEITPQTRFFCSGRLKVGVREFNCWSAHGSQDLVEAIAHSCNVYFYHLALLLGPATLSEYALKFGLGRQTGIDLPYEVSGNVPSALARRMKLMSALPVGRHWYDGDTVNFGIGQGDLLVSPIQAAHLMAVVANKGALVTAHIVESVVGSEIKPRSAIKLDLDKKAVAITIEGMKEVVNARTGTANIGDWSGLKVAGKTGTAQVKDSPSHGWFVGFLPYDKPKIAFCFFLENVGHSVPAVILAQQVFRKMKEENLLQ
jgi:penicillin-binding protein 2